jgi:hypothetical protein
MPQWATVASRFSGYATIARQGRGWGAGQDTGCGAGGIDIVGMLLSTELGMAQT